MLDFFTHQYFSEGVDDPAIFKAIFLCGGPGSGKSFIVGKTGLPQLGYRVVNSDDAFEAAMAKAGKAMTPDEIFSDEGQRIRGRAKVITAKKQALYIKGRLGLVIDGTGKDMNKILMQNKQLRKLGYDTAMIFVKTDLETAIERDAQRSRSLGTKKVTFYWNSLIKNIGNYKTLFGRDFELVNNSKGDDYQKETLRAYKKMRKFTDSAPDNELAKKWIKQERERKKR